MALKIFSTSSPKLGKDYEHLEQVAFFARLSWVNHPAVKLTFAVPNQAVAKYKSIKARMRFVREGVKGGVADVVCLHPSWDGRYHGLVIENKRPGEKPRADQKEFLEAAVEAGHNVFVCFSAKQAFQVWCEHLGLNLTY